MAGHTTITVNGLGIGLRFGLPAIKRISDKINLLSGSEEITLNLMSMVHILYAGYVNDCLSNDQEALLDFKFFYDFVEDAALHNEMEEIRRVIEVFASSKEMKGKDEGQEKKNPSPLIGKKSKSSVSGRTGTTPVLHGGSISY